MTFTAEQMNKARSAKTAEELLEMAKEAGIEMTEAQAAKYFAELHKEGELSDDELGTVAGGSKGEEEETHPEPKFQEGGSAWYIPQKRWVTIISYSWNDNAGTWRYYVHEYYNVVSGDLATIAGSYDTYCYYNEDELSEAATK